MNSSGSQDVSDSNIGVVGTSSAANNSSNIASPPVAPQPEMAMDLHYLFSQLEVRQQQLCIVDYSISQLSLEHVFLTLTESESEETSKQANVNMICQR